MLKGILVSLGVGLLPAACSDEPGKAGQTKPERPEPKQYNVLLISLDTLRADHLGVYGYGREVSPRIDAFAGRSIRFERAYSHAPWTTPAHAAMLTSLYPTMMGLHKYPETGRIGDRVETMAEFFKAHGYLTQAVTEGGMVHAEFGFAQGFDYYFQSARHVDHGVEKTFAWLDKYGDHPFFFFFHTYDVHRYDPPDEFRELFTDPAYKRLRQDPDLAKKIQEYENRDFVDSLEEEDLKYIVDLYDASIRWVDRYVDSLLEYLERRGLLKKTIVVVTSDHGEEFLERSRTGHGYSNFEEQIRVPLIFHHPDLEPGIRHTMFRHIDLLPTLAEAVGLPRRPEWLGESLWDAIALGNESPGEDRKLSFCECGHSNYRSVQSLRWKLIDNKTPEKILLYDLEGDPLEKQDVSKENPEMQRRLKDLLDRIEKFNREISPRFAGEGVNQEDLPEDLLEQLRKLGYAK
jgi:arylsulfatase A-like enzyme